ncbi:MAG TPA: hypothetical protein DDW50_15700 [Firmicutes bacterium]|jgi:two-component system, sensor histidine kinase YesM|nr:hypothetical protein [Bacillota bacterium]
MGRKLAGESFPVLDILRNWIRGSFRVKLTLAFFGVISLALFMISFIYYHRAKIEIEQNTYANMDQLADQTVTTIQTYMENIKNLAWSYFSDSDFQNFMVEMNEKGQTNFDLVYYYFNKIATNVVFNSFIGAIEIRDFKGERLSTDINGSQNISRFYKDEDIKNYQSAYLNHGWAIWLPTHAIHRLRRNEIFTLSYFQALKKINIDDQKVVGVIRIDMAASELKKRLGQMKIKSQGHFYLVNREGRIIMAEKDDDVGRILQSGALFQKCAESQESAGHFMYYHQGHQYLGVYHRFHDLDWMLVGYIPLSVIMSGVTKAGWETFIIGFLCLGITFLLAFFIFKGVTRPIYDLHQAMIRLGQGHFDTIVPIQSADEIGFLGNQFNIMTQEIQRLISKIFQTELLKKQAEVKALQAQINPHFLYNSLGMIDSLATLEGEKQISTISQALSNMFRYSISGGQYATLAEEIYQVEQYLTIQKFRFEERLSYQIYIEANLDTLRLPKLLLQPLVENAIIHGLEKRKDRGSITIRAQIIDSDWVKITVSDNGIGMTEIELQRIQDLLSSVENEDMMSNLQLGSIGLANVAQRIKLFNNGRLEMKVSSEFSQGTIVTFLLPKNLGGNEHV